jgi:hypothetical protein
MQNAVRRFSRGRREEISVNGIAIVAAGALALTAGTALAASSGSLSIEQLVVELVDLDPGDGVEPSARFGGPDLIGTNHIWVLTEQTDTGVSQDASHYPSGTAWTPTTVAASAGSAWSVASYGGRDDADGILMSVFGSAGDFNSPNPDKAMYRADAWGSLFTVTLSPRTTATFSVLARANIQTRALHGLNSDAVRLNAAIWVDGTVPGDSAKPIYDDDVLRLQRWAHFGAKYTESTTQSLSVTLHNATAYSLGAYFGGSLSLHGETYVNHAPVPETETYALMAAGLAVVGFVAQRRRRSRHSRAVP